MSRSLVPRVPVAGSAANALALGALLLSFAGCAPGGGTAGTSGAAGDGAGGISGGAGTTGAAGANAGNTGNTGNSGSSGGPGVSGAAGSPSGVGGAGLGGVAGMSGNAGTTGAAGAGGLTGAGGGGQAPAGPSLIGDVMFSTPSQTFRGQLSVGMTSSIGGAEIRYTTDGQLPTASSTLYGGAPITVTATTQLRAQPFLGGAPAGRVSTALYIARDFDATSALPILILDGYGKGLSTNKDLYLDAAIMIFEPSGGGASIAALPTLAARAGYHLRGQSSASFPQKPYRIELWDNANQDAKYPVLGMPADGDWALIAPYYDRALIRNPFVYELGRDMGLEAPRTRFVEVYINAAARPVAQSDYQGIYWLTETIENSSERTNLKQLQPTDTTLPAISGGYIFKFDQLASEEPRLVCTGGAPIGGGRGGLGGRSGTGGAGGAGAVPCWADLEVTDPEPLGAEQKTWMTNYVQTFHNSLHATPIGNYGQYIDVPSFVDYLLVNELTRNVDSYVRSAYYHKERDGKIKAGPLWDYNFSLAVGGMTTIAPAPATNPWQYQGSRNINNWYPKLTGDPAFMNQVKARYRELRGTLLSQSAIDQRISEITGRLDTTAVMRDYAKWPVSDVLPNGNRGIVYGPSVPTWQEQVAAMRTFVHARLAFMDSQLLQ